MSHTDHTPSCMLQLRLRADYKQLSSSITKTFPIALDKIPFVRDSDSPSTLPMKSAGVLDTTGNLIGGTREKMISTSIRTFTNTENPKICQNLPVILRHRCLPSSGRADKDAI